MEMTYCSNSPSRQSTATGNTWDRLESTHRQAVPSTILAADYSSRVKQYLALGEEKLRRRIGPSSFGTPSTTFLEVLDELDGVVVIATTPEKPPNAREGGGKRVSEEGTLTVPTCVSVTGLSS